MTTTYRADDAGIWVVDGVVEMLTEPSDSYLEMLRAREEAREQQAWLDSLIPTEDEVRQAENELNTITLLMEVGLL